MQEEACCSPECKDDKKAKDAARNSSCARHMGPVDQPWAALLEADPKGAVSALLGPAQGYHGIVIATVLPGVVELALESLQGLRDLT